MMRSLKSTARQALLRINSFRKPSAAILLYHRVAARRVDPWGMAVSPANFAEQMAVLRAWGRTETLGAATDWRARSRAKGCVIAVTFDDGYRDNLANALPVLEREGIPATLYAVSGALGDPMAFWWELLVTVLLETAELPEHLRLDPGESGATWRLGADAIYDSEALARAASWDADEEEPGDRRQNALLEMWSFLAGLPPAHRRDAVFQIADWAAVDPSAGDGALSVPLTADELAEFASSPLIDIGGHTESHCDLSRMSNALALDDIVRDRRTLREITGQRVEHFGHPYGLRGPNTREHLLSAGYLTATNSGLGVSAPVDDPYWLPRIKVPDIGGEEFEIWISWLTGLPRPRRRPPDPVPKSRK